MKNVVTDRAPAAIGPYSQALVSGGFVFCSGQLGIDPVSGKLDDDVAVQTRQALENLRAVLAAAQCTLADVVKTTVFVTDLGDFAIVNEIYATAFAEHRPARACVQVAALPKGGKVEIEAIAQNKC